MDAGFRPDLITLFGHKRKGKSFFDRQRGYKLKKGKKVRVARGPAEPFISYHKSRGLPPTRHDRRKKHPRVGFPHMPSFMDFGGGVRFHVNDNPAKQTNQLRSGLGGVFQAGIDGLLGIGEEVIGTLQDDLVDSAHWNPFVFASRFIEKQQGHITDIADELGVDWLGTVANVALDMGIGMVGGPLVTGAMAGSRLIDGLANGHFDPEQLSELLESGLSAVAPQFGGVVGLIDAVDDFAPGAKKAIEFGQDAAGLFNSASTIAQGDIEVDDIRRLIYEFGGLADKYTSIELVSKLQTAETLFLELKKDFYDPIAEGITLEKAMEIAGNAGKLYNAWRQTSEHDMHAMNAVEQVPMQRLGAIAEEYITPRSPFDDLQQNRIPDWGAPLRGHINFGDDHSRETMHGSRDLHTRMMFDPAF